MEYGVVLKRRGPSLTALLRWSGLVLVAGGLLMAVATALHPSRETPATILQSEVRLVAAHVLFTLSYLLVLLGLPGLYGTQSVVGFVMFGMAMAKRASFPRSSGILVVVGAPSQVLGFGLAQLVSPALWTLAILGSVALGAGLAWPGYQLWQTRHPDPLSPAPADADRHHSTRFPGRAASP